MQYQLECFALHANPQIEESMASSRGFSRRSASFVAKSLVLVAASQIYIPMIQGQSAGDHDPSFEVLNKIVSMAAKKQLAALRGEKVPETQNSWRPKLDAKLPSPCTVDYDPEDHGYTYSCQEFFRTIEKAQARVEDLEEVASKIDGADDAGVKDDDQLRSTRHRYRVGGVDVYVSLHKPSTKSNYPKWDVLFTIYPPD